MKIRQPNAAGSYYPDDKNELEYYLHSYLTAAPRPKAKNGISAPTALIAPHAGYIYSGLTAAAGYNLLPRSIYKKIILLGPSHHLGFHFAGLDNSRAWATPLGRVSLDKTSLKKLEGSEEFRVYPEVFDLEHSLEVQVPFLQIVLANFKLIPISLGQDVNHAAIAEELIKIIDKKTLLVVSTDLSHYLPQQKAVETDQKSIEAILSKDSQKIADTCDACGTEAIMVLNKLAREFKWQPKLIDYRTSAEATGDKSAVVGYATIAYF